MLRNKTLGNVPLAIGMCFATVVALAADESLTVGVVAQSDREFRVAAGVAKQSPEVKLVNVGAKAEPGKLASCGVVIVSAPFLTKTATDALDAYARKGGMLVVMGRAGEYEDRDANGRWSKGDKRTWALSELCGVQRLGAAGDFETLRVWGPHPFFMAFQRYEPFALHKGKAPGVVAVANDATPVASGVFIPSGLRRKGKPEMWSWYAAARACGESAFITVRRLERGGVVFVAENLLLAQATPYQKVLLHALLSPLVLTVRQGQLPPMPEVAAKDGNLVFNGDFERVALIYDAYSKNAAKPPFRYPFGWQYNSWGGGAYKLTAKPVGKGVGSYFSSEYAGKAGDAASATCVLRYRHYCYHPRAGADYALSYRIRATRPVRVGLWGKLTNGKPWRCPVGVVKNRGKDWQAHEQTFRVPRAVFPAPPTRSFYLDFAVSGGASIDLDDVVLKAK